MLSLKQSNEFNRAKRLKDFLDTKTSIFSANVPFNNRYTSFGTHVTTFTQQATLKDGNSTGTTIAKDTLKHKIAKTLGRILGKTYTYAKAINNATLKETVNHSESEIYKMKDADVLPFINNINTTVYTATLLADAVFITYGITAAQIAAIVADAVSFNNMIGQAGVTTAANNTANDNINAVIDLIHSDIEDFDNLIVDFEATQPDFVTNYEANVVLNNLGVHHTGVEGTITRNGEPLPNIVVSIQGTTKTDTTDSKGHYSIVKMKPGNYIVEFAISSGQNAKPITVSRGNIATLDLAI